MSYTGHDEPGPKLLKKDIKRCDLQAADMGIGNIVKLMFNLVNPKGVANTTDNGHGPG